MTAEDKLSLIAVLARYLDDREQIPGQDDLEWLSDKLAVILDDITAQLGTMANREVVERYARGE